MGLAFCPSVFELSSFDFIFLPFCGCLSLCEVVGGDFEACFLLLYAVLSLGEADVVDLEVLI